MACSQKTDSTYITNYINNWKLGNSDSSCSTPGLLEFIQALVISKSSPNTLVRNWCKSCVTIQANPLGYLTMKGAKGISLGDERPIYYLRGDQVPATQLTKYNYDPTTGKWSDSTWINVVVKYPVENIYIADGINISIRTVKVGDRREASKDRREASKDTAQPYTAEPYGYYLFIVNPECGQLPMPLYQYVGDFSNFSTNISNANWPLLKLDGTSFLQLTGCPENCTDWKWLE